jgi:hypothetical protein
MNYKTLEVFPLPRLALLAICFMLVVCFVYSSTPEDADVKLAPLIRI